MSHHPSSATVPDLREIAALFDIRADFIDGVAYGSGHINDTYCAVFDQAGRVPVRHILQRINTNVFKTPELLMENIARVTRHSLDRLIAEGNPEARRRRKSHSSKPVPRTARASPISSRRASSPSG